MNTDINLIRDHESTIEVECIVREYGNRAVIRFGEYPNSCRVLLTFDQLHELVDAGQTALDGVPTGVDELPAPATCSVDHEALYIVRHRQYGTANEATCHKCEHELGTLLTAERRRELVDAAELLPTPALACDNCGGAVTAREGCYVHTDPKEGQDDAVRGWFSCGVLRPELDIIDIAQVNGQYNVEVEVEVEAPALTCDHCKMPVVVKNGEYKHDDATHPGEYSWYACHRAADYVGVVTYCTVNSHDAVPVVNA